MEPGTPRRRSVAIALGCTAALSSIAHAELPAPLGWSELPDTKIADVCAATHGFPSVAGPGQAGCSGVTNAWNSAVFDVLHNRLVIWGGGHGDYHGNEAYGLELDDVSMVRLTDPSLLGPTDVNNDGSTGDGQASSRHTYDHIVFMDHLDRMFVFGGAGAPGGFMLDDTWTFDLRFLTWQRMNPTGPKPEANYGRVTGYNPATRLVYIADQTTLFSYSYEDDAYTALGDHSLGQTQTGVVDPTRELFLMIGGGRVVAYHVGASSNFVPEEWTTTGGGPIVEDDNPGVAYDPVSDRVVAWSGGDTVYTLNLDTRAWTAVTSFTGGPGAAFATGTFKRWAYAPAENAFVVVNAVDDNAWAFRLTTGSGPHLPPAAPTNLVVE